ncbi:ATP cone domain-containing protein [Clostridium thermarum]|uniref:ATP cone domain-containing protein n=1 Tax=Clostridium thermarum TaxID=1716543 RepID=UPI00111FD0CE|nr:ATP cone domain-containing protein [Clostridium thermarum]
MKVIKKDRRIQDFDLRKTVLSIERASDDLNESINESDAENIANSITRELNKLGINMIESYKIKDIIIQVLQELGFNGLANIYARGSKQ